jgi:hypothetical protein
MLDVCLKGDVHRIFLRAVKSKEEECRLIPRSHEIIRFSSDFQRSGQSIFHSIDG